MATDAKSAETSGQFSDLVEDVEVKKEVVEEEKRPERNTSQSEDQPSKSAEDLISEQLRALEDFKEWQSRRRAKRKRTKERQRQRKKAMMEPQVEALTTRGRRSCRPVDEFPQNIVSFRRSVYWTNKEYQFIGMDSH